MDSSKIKVECIFNHKANIHFKYWSDIVFVHSNLLNVIVKFNDSNLPPSDYVAGVEKTKSKVGEKYAGYIRFKKILTSKKDFNIYMSYEAKIAHHSMLQYNVNLCESPIKSEPQTNVIVPIILIITSLIYPFFIEHQEQTKSVKNKKKK